MSSTKKNEAAKVSTSIDLKANILSCLTENNSVKAASEKLSVLKEKKARLESELTAFNQQKINIDNEINELKQNFGESDSFADQEKLEKLEIKKRTVSDSIPLVEKRLAYNEGVNREIQDAEQNLKHELHLCVMPIQKDLQHQMDDLVIAIHDFFENLEEALSSICREQKMHNSPMFVRGAIKHIIPEVEGLEEYVGDGFGGLALASREKAAKNFEKHASKSGTIFAA